MQQILDSVEFSLISENWLSALYVAITLPDICAATENTVKGNGPRYKDWFNRYLKKKYDPDSFYEYVEANHPERIRSLTSEMVNDYKSRPVLVKFTADYCWALRNAILHEGVDESKLKNFRITVPDERNNIVHLTHDPMRTFVQIDASIFCRDVIIAVKQWQSDMSCRQDVLEKINGMICIREHRFVFA